MASKLVGLIIFAVFLNATSAIKNITLNIGRYKPDQDPNKPAPNPYKIFEFSPKAGKKLSRAVLGPMIIYEDLTLKWHIVSLHLETLNLVPQIAKLILTDGANQEILYYKWEKHGFVKETYENHASYKFILTNNALVASTPYLDVSRQINFMVFDTSIGIFNEVPITTVKPKDGYTMHHIISGNDSLIKSEEPVLSVSGYRMGDQFKTIEGKFESPKPTVYWVLEEKTWIQCDHQKFLEKSKNTMKTILKHSLFQQPLQLLLFMVLYLLLLLFRRAPIFPILYYIRR